MNFVELANGFVLFTAFDSDGGNAGGLWVTDGTAAGTQLVHHFDVAPENGMTAFADGKRVLFRELVEGTEADGADDPEPWVSDGTPSGTHILANINKNPMGGSDPLFFNDIGGGKAIFTIRLSSSQPQLYVTDGTEAGTTPIGVTAGGVGLVDSNDSSIENTSYHQKSNVPLANGSILFAGLSHINSMFSTDLWVTNGQDAGTFKLSDKVASPEDFLDLGNGRIVFRGTDATGVELWVTDGNDEGTERIADINQSATTNGDLSPIPASSNPHDFTSLGAGTGEAVFVATNEGNQNQLWVTDGTSSGTKVINATASNPNNVFSMGNGTVLYSDQGLWSTDGSSTQLISSVVPGNGFEGAADFEAIGDGRVLFSGNDGVHGSELWITDGTPGGTTRMVKDIDPTSSSPGFPNSGLSNVPYSGAGLTPVGGVKSAADYIKQYLKLAHTDLDNPLNPHGATYATDEEIAQSAISSVITAREQSALTSSKNLALRDAEYFFRGYLGGLQLHNHHSGNDLANGVANRLSPISTAVYNAKKALTSALGVKLKPDELPGTPPGGYDANVFGWARGLIGEPLSNVVTDFAAKQPGTQTPATDEAAPLAPLTQARGDGNGVAVFALRPALGGVVSYFDPTPADNYGFSVQNNTITGILIPTSVSTSPVTVSIPGQTPVTVTPGTLFDLTTLVPDGVTALAVSGDFSAGANPSFGFTFSQDNETLVAEAQKLPVSIDSTIKVIGPAITLTGTVFSPNGVSGVELFEGDTDLGAARVKANGTWSFAFDNGAGFHTGIQAVATDADGVQSTAPSYFDLTTDIRGAPYRTVQDSYDTTAFAYEGSTYYDRSGSVYFKSSFTADDEGQSTYSYSSGSFFEDKVYSSYSDMFDADGNLTQHVENNNDGSHTIRIDADNQTVAALGTDLFTNNGSQTRFVLDAAAGQETIMGFKVAGAGHDTIDLPDSQSSRLAKILASAQGVGQGDTTITFAPGDTITFAGVSVAQLQKHAQDFVFQA